MDFKAELKDGELFVKPIIEKVGDNITIHVPSFPLIQKLIKEEKDKKK